MANEKMTKTEKYEAIRAILVEAGADEELVALCDHEVELIAAKAEKAKARAAEKKADGDELRATIESLLTDTPQIPRPLRNCSRRSTAKILPKRRSFPAWVSSSNWVWLPRVRSTPTVAR